MIEKCQSTPVGDSREASQDCVRAGIQYETFHRPFALLQSTAGVTLLDSKLHLSILSVDAGISFNLHRHKRQCGPDNRQLLEIHPSASFRQFLFCVGGHSSLKLFVSLLDAPPSFSWCNIIFQATTASKTKTMERAASTVPTLGGVKKKKEGDVAENVDRFVVWTLRQEGGEVHAANVVDCSATL